MTNSFGGAANSFMDALKGQPLALALVVMNLGLLGYLYYAGIQAHSERQEEMKLLYENRREMAQLLYLCTPSGGQAPTITPRPQKLLTLPVPPPQL
jgi:hypothetical protein